MAKKEKEEQEKPRSIWRYLFLSVAGVSVLIFGIFAFQRTEHYLITNPRFVLSGPADYGDESPNLHVEGARHRAVVGQGAGVVADSTPEGEYQETVNKAKAMLKAVALAEGFVH